MPQQKRSCSTSRIRTARRRAIRTGSRQSIYAFGFDPTSLGWPSSLVSQLPAARVGNMFPVVTFDQFVTLSRGFGPNTNKNFSIQPNLSMNRGAHNIRSGLDIRRTNVFSDNYGNAGGQIDFNRNFTRGT